MIIKIFFKIFPLLLIILIFVSTNIKYEYVDPNDLKKEYLTIYIKSNNKINEYKCKKGTAIIKISNELNIDLSSYGYDNNYILNDLDTVNISDLPSINTIDINELKKIPYISKENASAIIEYRNKHGLFTNFIALKEIKGIGISKIKILEKFLTI